MDTSQAAHKMPWTEVSRFVALAMLPVESCLALDSTVPWSTNILQRARQLRILTATLDVMFATQASLVQWKISVLISCFDVWIAHMNKMPCPRCLSSHEINTNTQP